MFRAGLIAMIGAGMAFSFVEDSFADQEKVTIDVKIQRFVKVYNDYEAVANFQTIMEFRDESWVDIDEDEVAERVEYMNSCLSQVRLIQAMAGDIVTMYEKKRFEFRDIVLMPKINRLRKIRDEMEIDSVIFSEILRNKVEERALNNPTLNQI